MTIFKFLLLLLAGFAACQSTEVGNDPYDQAFHQARVAVSELTVAEAETALEYLDEVNASGEVSRSDYLILRASLALRMSRYETVLDYVRQAKASDDLGRNQLAVSEELAGKAEMRLGVFDRATSHFEEASRLFDHPEDADRTSDLALLSRGLELYSSGHLNRAHSTWKRIRDPQLTQSLKDSLQGVTLSTSH